LSEAVVAGLAHQMPFIFGTQSPEDIRTTHATGYPLKGKKTPTNRGNTAHGAGLVALE